MALVPVAAAGEIIVPSALTFVTQPLNYVGAAIVSALTLPTISPTGGELTIYRTPTGKRVRQSLTGPKETAKQGSPFRTPDRLPKPSSAPNYTPAREKLRARNRAAEISARRRGFRHTRWHIRGDRTRNTRRRRG